MANPGSIPSRESIKTGYWIKPPSFSMGRERELFSRA